MKLVDDVDDIVVNDELHDLDVFDEIINDILHVKHDEVADELEVQDEMLLDDDELDEFDFIDIDDEAEEVVENVHILIDIDVIDEVIEMVATQQIVDDDEVDDTIVNDELAHDEDEETELLKYVIQQTEVIDILVLQVEQKLQVDDIIFIHLQQTEHSVLYHNNKKTQITLNLFLYMSGYYKLNPSRIAYGPFSCPIPTKMKANDV